MISRKTEEVLNRAGQYAFEQRHEFCTIEHVFWALLHETSVQEVLDECGAEFETLLKEIEQYLDRDMAKSSPLGSSEDSENTEDRSLEKNQPNIDPPMITLAVQNLLQRALFHVQSAGKDEVKPIDLFVALFQAKDSYALYLLQKQKVERLDVIKYLSHGTLKDDSNLPQPGPESSDGDDEPKKRQKLDPLKSFTVNLNELAEKGKIDPLIGRQAELDRMIQTLCRRRKNNPLLVGEAGVGKTALAEGLALRIVSGQVPSILEKAEVYSLDMGTLLAGTRFRGDFEQRLKRVLAALMERTDQGQMPILFIDEIHTIIGAGSVSGGTLDAANLLKPALSRGELRCIGSTTYSEYRNIFEKDHALSRRFQKIDIPEPSIEDTIQILKGLKSRLEDFHNVEITEDALKSAVELSSNHLTDRFLPDKAIDIIDEAGAKARLVDKKVVDSAFIEEIISQIARIPARSVNTNQKQKLKNIDRDLKLSIFGQDNAIDSIVSAIRLSRSGLRSEHKPIGSFLFCGPTGVGKTELSKQLAHCLGVNFHRFDMSEYMEKHTVSRLIGAPPGYVGYEQAGLLTEAVRKNPHSILLLDEVEKAHPDVWNLLLQVMDHGTLTDNYGRKADFKNCIIILTSNVGSRELEKRPLGMSGSEFSFGNAQKEVERTFSPEFRNRLDAILYFNPLDPKTIAQVVDKQLVELESQLLSKNVEMDVSTEVREWLAKKGYDRLMGARPMARLIQDKIRKPLSEQILFGSLEHGGKVEITLKNDELHFVYQAKKALVPVSSSGSGSGKAGSEKMSVE